MKEQSKIQVSNISVDLAVDRLWTLASLGASVITALLLVYIAFNRGRVEIVYLSSDKFDAPVILDKVSSSQDSLKNDRYIKGMIRRFVSNYWITPDMASDEVVEALQWSIVHTSNRGVQRGRTFLRDLENFNNMRMTKWTAFKPLLDDDSVTIKKSGLSSNKYLITVPGTYVSVTNEGENYSSAVLRMIIVASGVSGIPDRDAGETINATGLTVSEAVVSIESGSDTPTIIELF